MNALKSQFTGEGPAALFVGGCVRNVLSGEDVYDIDMATPLVPADVIRAAKASQIKVALTGIEHGTLTLIVDKQPFQVTSLREDVMTDGRYARVAFSSSWIADAKRRDFTINTLLMDEDGNIFDPLGCGIEDLAQGRIRFVGDAETRIREDYLRILRFFRFQGRYGRLPPDEAALSACRAHAPEMENHLSVERIRDELRKILIIKDPTKTLQIMFKNNIIKSFINTFNEDSFSRFCSYQNIIDQVSVLPRFLYLCDFNMEVFKARADQLKFPKAETVTGLMILNAYSELKTISEKDLKLLIYHYNYPIAASAFLIRISNQEQKTDLTLLRLLENWTVPIFPLSGKDLMDIGMNEGEKLGRSLAEAERLWLESSFSLDRESLMKTAQEYYKK